MKKIHTLIGFTTGLKFVLFIILNQFASVRKVKVLCFVIPAILAGGIAIIHSGCSGGGAMPSTQPQALNPNPTPTPDPDSPQEELVFDAIIGSTCSDNTQDTYAFLNTPTGQGNSQEQVIEPDCYPLYRYKYGGLHTSDGRPLPRMGRTCGDFHVFVVFLDNPTNRVSLAANSHFTQATKDLINEGQIKEALERVLISYTRKDLLGWMDPSASNPLPMININFEVEVTSEAMGEWPSFATLVSGASNWTGSGWRNTEVFEPTGIGERFSDYDAVLLLYDLPQAGWGLQRWPKQHPTFHSSDSSFVFRIDPEYLSPGLLTNELFRRNIPTLLYQYTLGPTIYETRNGVTYDITPIYNPRTGEDIRPLIDETNGNMDVSRYYAGWRDIDRDGIKDCVDSEITPTEDNVDGDLVPDRLDPDLDSNNSAFFWMPMQ